MTPNSRFNKDPVTKENLYPPQELLKIRAGDCDDISMLLGAFLLALGYPARLITVSANPGQPQEFSHVYVEAEIPAGSGQWVPMDAARLDSQFGAEPPRYFRKRAWSLTEDSHQDLSGCGCRTRLSGLSGYATLGQFDWNSIIQQGLQEVPQIIAVSSGQSSQVRTPQGVVATGPYSSFVTPNTPGYGVPPAGYLAVGSSWQPYLPLIIGGALLLLFLRK